MSPQERLPRPVNPSPPNGATGVVLTPTLAWSAGLGATSYSVYFGTSSTPPLVTSTTGTIYSPGHLDGEQEVLLESGGQGRRQVNQFTRLVIHDR